MEEDAARQRVECPLSAVLEEASQDYVLLSETRNGAGIIGLSGPEQGARILSVQRFCRRLVRAGER